jgi:hypothetical protein
MAMRHGVGANGWGHNPSERRADNHADEARLGLLLERTYAAREARLMPADDALAKLNAALDAIGTSRRQHADHRRLFGACALAALLLLLLSPIARSEFTGSTRNATRSVAIPTSSTNSASSDLAANAGIILSPVMAAERAGSNATNRTPAANGTAPMTGVSETPLRDLLARAGIQPTNPTDGSSGEGQPHQHGP